MREIMPRPILLALTLILVIGAVVFIELRLDAAGTQSDADKRSEGAPQSAGKVEDHTNVSGEKKENSATGSSGRAGRSNPTRHEAGKEPKQTVSDAVRVASKQSKYSRAKELTGSTGLINTDGVSIRDAVGEKVVLVEFWTYSCINCQNAQPHINALYEKYREDGLLVVGIHSPEFGFEKDISNVREAVDQANIEYPVVLDNNYAIWNAYDQRFWPAWYLIDADGFIRYRHFGEGAYDETDHKVRELLAEKNRTSD